MRTLPTLDQPLDRRRPAETMRKRGEMVEHSFALTGPLQPERSAPRSSLKSPRI